MKMNIQVQRATETLDQGDGACVSRRFCITGFSGQVRSNGAVDDTQRLAHDFGLAGKQKPERKRHAEYPLAHGLMGQYFTYQQGSTFCHTACPATGTKATTFAAKGDQVLRMASLTLHPQKTMLKMIDRG